ncbi:MAG TPA: zinc ABC transporter substrate-binding protein [bacterium]|nr:zinc ABC transporter substrate-binding protein [bacterium]
MKTIIHSRAWIPGLILLCLSVSSWAAEPTGGEALAVFSSIPPQGYVLERIGGQRLSVTVLLPQGRDPHTFEPTPKQLTEVSKAAVFFTIGLPFEKVIVEKLSNLSDRLRFVDMAEGINRIQISDDEHEHKHEHGESCDHSPDGTDPHIWLSPVLLEVLATNTARALEQMDAVHSDEYKMNLAHFLAEIRATHLRIQGILEPYRGRTFFVFHPAFGYFGQAYGLKQQAVEIRGREPAPKQLALLIKKAKAENVRIILVQPQFDGRAAQTIASAIGGVVAPMDPLEKNLLQSFENMAALLEKAFSADTKQRTPSEQ